MPSLYLELTTVMPYCMTYRLKTYGSRSFSICAPRLWNNLPVDIRKTSTITEFKSKLKTFLSRQTFNEFHIEALQFASPCDSGHVQRQNNGILFPTATWIYSYVKTTIVSAFQHGLCHVVMQSLYRPY